MEERRLGIGKQVGTAPSAVPRELHDMSDDGISIPRHDHAEMRSPAEGVVGPAIGVALDPAKLYCPNGIPRKLYHFTAHTQQFAAGRLLLHDAKWYAAAEGANGDPSEGRCTSEIGDEGFINAAAILCFTSEANPNAEWMRDRDRWTIFKPQNMLYAFRRWCDKAEQAFSCRRMTVELLQVRYSDSELADDLPTDAWDRCYGLKYKKFEHEQEWRVIIKHALPLFALPVDLGAKGIKLSVDDFAMIDPIV